MKKQLLTARSTQIVKSPGTSPDVIKTPISKSVKKSLVKARVIRAAKANIIRKDVVKLKRQATQLCDSITVTKKVIGQLVNNMKNDLDSMSEMGEMESLRLQMAMDRLSKLMSTLSNMLKKMNDTAQSITQNLK